MKKFKYTKITESCYLSYSDEIEEFGDDFYYEANDKEMIPYIVDFLYEDHFKDLNVTSDIKRAIKNSIKNMIEDCDLVDALSDRYEDDLKEALEENAKEWYNS